MFSKRRKAGGLIMNSQQSGIGGLLWKYFNAPGNVMFVTFNIITFAGLVTFNSLISAQRRQVFELRLIEAQNNMVIQSMGTLKNSTSEAIPTLKSNTKDEHVVKPKSDSPIHEYTFDEIELSSKPSRLTTYDSQVAKMSLFHMMYAYFLMKHVTSNGTTNPKSILWDEEIKIIQEMLSNVDGAAKQAGRDKLLRFFYSSWRKEFGSLFDNLHKSQKFHFPDWKYYPENMRYACSNLYKNDMHTIDDFAQFYESIQPKELKRLLRFWFADNLTLISPSVNGNKEDFYRTLIKDSYGDDPLFQKYSSILWNADSRKRFFFPTYADKQLRTASIDTILTVLQGYIILHEKKGIRHNAEIIRLISMIKKDCVIAKNQTGKGVRIFLPTDTRTDLIDDEFEHYDRMLRDRQKCYELVSRNPKVIKLLDKISKWNETTTT